MFQDIYLMILHFTLFPRRNAGRLESFIVKLNSEQLQRQQITPPDRSIYNPVDFSSLLNSANLRHAVVQQSLNSALQTALNRKRQIEQDSYSFIQNLSAVPIALRSNALFVGQGTSSESAIDTARQRGVELISNALGRARIRLSESDFAILGIRNIENFRTRINDSGSIRVNTTLDSICGFLQQKNGGTQLTRQVPDLLR